MSDFEEVVKSKTNEELVDIYVNAADYQPEFLALAEAEVVKRNIPLESLKSIREQKESIDERILEIGEQGNVFWILLGFLASLAGGAVGIIVGYNFAYSKRENLKGEEIFYYNETTRKYGRWMLTFGCLILSLSFLGRVI